MKKIAHVSLAGLLALSFVSANVYAAKRDKDGPKVSGVVNDEAGKPVTNSLVRLLHRGEDGKLHEVQHDTTNDDGEFNFHDVDNGTYVVVATSGRKTMRDRTTVTVKNKSVDPISFTLKKGEEDAEERAAQRDASDRYSNLKGTVKDKHGDPVKNATIRLLTGDDNKNTDKVVEVDTVNTDSKGRFAFYKVVNGHYYVEVADGKKGSRKEVTLRPDNGDEKVELTTK